MTPFSRGVSYTVASHNYTIALLSHYLVASQTIFTPENIKTHYDHICEFE